MGALESHQGTPPMMRSQRYWTKKYLALAKFFVSLAMLKSVHGQLPLEPPLGCINRH